MARNDVIITNWSLSKMKQHGLSEKDVMDAFHKGRVEKASGSGQTSVRKYSGYEIGVFYSRGNDGKWFIRSAWKRNRR